MTPVLMISKAMSSPDLSHEFGLLDNSQWLFGRAKVLIYQKLTTHLSAEIPTDCG